MKYAIALLFIATPVFAQTPEAQPSVDPLEQNLLSDWNAMMSANRHVQQDLQALINEIESLKAENAKLKAPKPADPAKK